ncbi:hypothetical protein SOX05_08575 [Pseudomonas putida]|nr:hypothetical protein [Pseudomonas putida]MDY4319315.1 hypothetical protein [Pseudomonas putida]MDY4352700.1 hypothetical protein [Pseudomonas putida]
MSNQPQRDYEVWDENKSEQEVQDDIQKAEWAEENKLNAEEDAKRLAEARAEWDEEAKAIAEKQNEVLPVTVDPVTDEIVITDGDTEYRITEQEVEEALKADEYDSTSHGYEDNAFIGNEVDLLEQQQRRKIAEEKALNQQSELAKKLELDHKEMLDTHNKFISKKRNEDDYLFWQEVKRKGQIVRKDFKMGEEVAEAAKAAGLNYKESPIPFRKSFKATDSTGKVAINYAGQKATFHDDYALDPATIKAGCLAVKQSGLKKPCIFAPTRMTAEQKTQFYSLCYENLLLAGYEPNKIKFDNPAFESQIRAKYAGYKPFAGIGDADSVEMTDGLTGGKGIKVKAPATPDELKMTDSAYALFQAADAAANRLMASTAWNQFKWGIETIDKNSVKDINAIANMSPEQRKEAELKIQEDVRRKKDALFSEYRHDPTVAPAFLNLANKLEGFKETYNSFDEKPEKYAEAMRAVTMLQDYGFNPSGKNKSWDIWSGSEAGTDTLKDISAGLKGLARIINEQNNENFATLDKNDMTDIKRRSGVMSKFKSQLEQGDSSMASSHSAIVKGSQLNDVLNKNSNRIRMFPDTAHVYKFNMTGEGVDLYFYAGKNGMEMIAGSGNKYSKPQRTNLSPNDLLLMMRQAEAKEYKADVKEEVKQEAAPDVKPDAKPVAAKDDVIDDLEKEFMSPDELKNLANGKKPEATKEAVPAAPEHVPVIDTFTIQSGNKTFDMEFKDGVASHAGVAYILKSKVKDIDGALEDILDKNDKVLAVKVLDTLPMDASCLLGANPVYETREKPVLVDNMYCIPGVTGNLIYELTNHDGDIEHSLKDRVKLAAEAAGIPVEKVNGVFKTDVHSYSLNEIKMSEVEGEDYSNKEGFRALSAIKREIEKEKVVGINSDVDVAETAKNGPKEKGVAFVDDDPTDNVESLHKQAPVSYKHEDAADYAVDDEDDFEPEDPNAGMKRRKPKYK